MEKYEKIAEDFRKIKIKDNNEEFQSKTREISDMLVGCDYNNEEWRRLIKEFGEAAKKHLADTVIYETWPGIEIFEIALNEKYPPAAEHEDSIE